MQKICIVFGFFLVCFTLLLSTAYGDTFKTLESVLKSSFNTEVEERNKVENIDNDQSSNGVIVNVDREDRIYRENETVSINVTASQDGYLYLINTNPKGERTLLIPNKYMKDNQIKAETKMTYPTNDMNFELRVKGPDLGQETIKAFVTKEPLQSLNNQKYVQNNATALDEEEAQQIVNELTGRKSIGVEERSANEDVLTGSVTYTTISQNQSNVTSKTPDRYALIFGLNEYSDNHIENLNKCVNDVKAFKKICIESFQVDEKKIAVFTNKSVTLQKVQQIFLKVKEITKPGDIIFIFWSGHGGRAASQNPDTPGSYDQFLVTYDGRITDPYNTMIMEDAFGHWVQELNGRKIVMIMDACYSGGMINNPKSVSAPQEEDSISDILGGDDFQEELENHTDPFTFGFRKFQQSKALGQRDLYVLASSSQDQQSYETPNDLSVMTLCLVDAINNGHHGMTHKELKSAIKQRVDNYMETHVRYAKQTVVDQDDLTPALIIKP